MPGEDKKEGVMEETKANGILAVVFCENEDDHMIYRGSLAEIAQWIEENGWVSKHKSFSVHFFTDPQAADTRYAELANNAAALAHLLDTDSIAGAMPRLLGTLLLRRITAEMEGIGDARVQYVHDKAA
jgi:hypothetical protein